MKRIFFKSRWQWRTAWVLAGSLGLVDAQSYSIDWYTIAGGGGRSSGGSYMVSGAIGQPESGMAMTGGNYSLTGGFWSLIAVAQTSGLPNLAVTVIQPNSVVVSWPTNGNFTLQQTSNLSDGTWRPSAYAISTADGTNTITLSPLAGDLYFRLKQ